VDLEHLDVPAEEPQRGIDLALRLGIVGRPDLGGTMVSARRRVMVAPRMRSALPYIGDESTNTAPASSAVSVIAWRTASTAGTSNVFDVPIPMTGTSMPANGRCSMAGPLICSPATSRRARRTR
jgi:hypothetical protein